MSASTQVMHAVNTHRISNSLISTERDKMGGLLNFDDCAWYAYGSTIVLYSRRDSYVMSYRTFADSVKITCVKELWNCESTYQFLLIGCSFKSSGKLFVCQLPTLTILRCIDLPNTVSSIASVLNNSHEESQLCDEFKIMSTIVLVGMVTGAVYAVDLRQKYLEKYHKSREFGEDDSKFNQLFIIRKNEDCEEIKEMSDDSDSHLTLFINENFHAYCKKQYNNKLALNVSSLLYIKEINTIAIGYSTGHFQLWDCKMMRTIYLLKEPKCVMPITQISFLEPSDDPNNLCYLWIIQSDNSKLPNATMIALTYEQKIVMPNGSLLYKSYRGSGVKLEMPLKRETGIGKCVSALSLSNLNLIKNKTDIDEDCEIKLFAMLLEIRQDVDCKPDSYVFLFDINQWYKAQMPSIINHLKVSNSYASFVKLPNDFSYLDFNISDKTLQPFGYNFRNNVEELYYPSSIFFVCDCLMESEIIRYKHAGIQQEILDALLSKNWKLLTNPTLVFSQCLETHLRPFFWDKPDNYGNYSLPDQRSFVISIIVEKQIIMPVLSACAEEWKNGTYVSSEATILHLVKSLWNHVMAVKQYADKLCVPLFDYSGTQLDKKNIRILNHCLCQMRSIKNFLQFLHKDYGINIVNVDYSHRINSLNLVIDYFKAVRCFLRYSLLPESLEDNIQSNVHCNFKCLIMYANKRRMEIGDSQLYLIDAVVFNEPKGNKLIEQWLHEGGEQTKGLYPPSNVQCLLRIYLNAALSELVKNFIIVYFLIDVCASQNMNVALANRMCNFALEIDIPNYKELNQICRASWLLDHDMFEDAIATFFKDRQWIEVINKSGDWFHWTVLKLLLLKREYTYALLYLDLANLNIATIDNHKFVLNVRIMNNRSFDALMYISKQPLENRDILYAYFFERCKETDKLESISQCSLTEDEFNLFDSFLKKFNDPETLNFHLKFLLIRYKYIEAYKLYKSKEGKPEFKNNDDLALTGVLVNKFYKNVPDILKQDFGDPFKKWPIKKQETTIRTITPKNTFCFVDKKRENVENIFPIKNPPITTSQPMLILPPRSIKQKHSPSNDLIYNAKRKKIDDSLLSPPESIKKIPNFVENGVLDILNTPLVAKTISSPSVTSCLSILKTGSANKPKRLLTLKSDEASTSRTVLRFSLPGENNTTNEQFGSGEELKSNYTNELTNVINQERSEISFKKIPDCCSEVELFENPIDQKQNETYEKMEISEEIEIDQEKFYNADSVSSNANVETLISDDEIEEKSFTELSGNQSSTSDENHLSIELGSLDREMKTPIPTVWDENSFKHTLTPINMHSCTVESVDKYDSINQYEPKPFDENNVINVESSSSVSEDSIEINESSSSDEDEVNVNSETEDETKNIQYDVSSSESSLKNNDDSSESDLDETKYGRFKYQKMHNNEDSEELEEESESEHSNESYKEKNCDNDSCDILSLGEEGNLERADVLSFSLSSEEKEVDEESVSERISSMEDDILEICDKSSSEDEEREEEEDYEEEGEEEEEEDNVDDNLNSNDKYSEENRYEKNVDLDRENDKIKSDSLYDIELLKTVDNNFSQNEVIENKLYTSENEVIDDDIEIEYTVMKSDACENLNDDSFELAKGNSSQHYEDEINNVKNVYNSEVDRENDINASVLEHKSYFEENISTSNSFTDFESNVDVNFSYKFNERNEQDIPPTTNDNYNYTSMNEPNLIPEDGFSNLMVPEIDPNVLETGNNVSCKSTSFLFGEQLFGQPENLDDKPMFLFGQVYSSDNEQIISDTIANTNDTQELMADARDEVFSNNESEKVESVDEIQDIIELRSLPESNPDENLGVQNCLKHNILPKCTESNIVNIKTLVSAEAENTKIGLKLCRTSFVRASSEPKQSNIVMDRSTRAISVPAKLQDILNPNILFNIQNVNNSVQKSIDTLTKQSRSISNPNILNTNSSNAEISYAEDVELNCFEHQSIPVNKINLRRGLRAKSEQLFENQCGTLDLTSIKSTNVHSRSMSTSNLNILYRDNSNNKSILVNEDSLNSSDHESVIENERNLRSKQATSKQMTEKPAIKMKNIRVIIDRFIGIEDIEAQNIKRLKSKSVIGEKKVLAHGERILRRSTRSKSEQPLMQTIIDENISAQSIGSEKEQPFIDKADQLKLCDQKIIQGDKKVHRSSRNSIKTPKDDSVVQKTPNIKKTPIKIKEYKPTSKSVINEQVDKDVTNQGRKSLKAKSISPFSNEIKVTRLKAKSESNIGSSSLNIFRSSEMIDESRQKRVILPKTKFNDKQNDELKPRGGRSKSLASMKELLTTKTAYGLENIIEEDISNPDKLVEKDSTAVPKKTKFNFNKNKSKLLNTQQVTAVKTPIKRAKSVQPVLPPPVATLSLVKPKRRSSVNYLVADDKSLMGENDFMKYIKKPLDSAKKSKKRPLPEPMKKESKQKVTKKVELNKNISKSDSYQSKKNLNDSFSYDGSSISGNDDAHTLYTPASKKLKHSSKVKTVLNFETDDSSDEINSERITRSKMKNSVTSTTHDLLKQENKVFREKSKSPKKSTVLTRDNSDKSLKNLKKSTNQPLNVEAASSERRMTRLLQSKLNCSQPSTSVIEQNEATEKQKKNKTKK